MPLQRCVCPFQLTSLMKEPVENCYDWMTMCTYSKFVYLPLYLLWVLLIAIDAISVQFAALNYT